MPHFRNMKWHLFGAMDTLHILICTKKFPTKKSSLYSVVCFRYIYSIQRWSQLVDRSSRSSWKCCFQDKTDACASSLDLFCWSIFAQNKRLLKNYLAVLQFICKSFELVDPSKTVFRVKQVKYKQCRDKTKWNTIRSIRLLGSLGVLESCLTNNSALLRMLGGLMNSPVAHSLFLPFACKSKTIMNSSSCTHKKRRDRK